MAPPPNASPGRASPATDARRRRSSRSRQRQQQRHLQPQQQQRHRSPRQYGRPPSRSAPNSNIHSPRLSAMQNVTVDSILQYTSDIPSSQPRFPPLARGSVLRPALPSQPPPVTHHTRSAASLAASQILPSRTTKVSEKLVLLPEAEKKDEPGDDSDDEGSCQNTYFTEDPEAYLEAAAATSRARAPPLTVVEDENRPLRDEELDVLRMRGGVRGKSYAERLPKVQRGEKVARVTAYCTAQAYQLQAAADFLREEHCAKTKLYDDCLYAVYCLPLLPGVDGYHVRSRPTIQTPGTGKNVVDLEIEWSERRDEHEGWSLDDEVIVGNPRRPVVIPVDAVSPTDDRPPQMNDDGSGSGMKKTPTSPTSPTRLEPDPRGFAELFIFSYGVIVFWNFTEMQEKVILGDLTFADKDERRRSGIPLTTRPLDEADFETEEFHFEYRADAARPRVFNDMITLRPRSDHMVKLAISHAIAQSTKLCVFEARMTQTLLETEHVPRQLATTGKLSMVRSEIVKIMGRLFRSRVDINLSSNVLDIPNFFWDSEPILCPLYEAVREYLEIEPRIKLLNERCRVFLDLAEILSDGVANSKMSSITWICIVLIVISIFVTVTEVLVRLVMIRERIVAPPVGGIGDGGVVGLELI